jgi:hypothetical protein
VEFDRTGYLPAPFSYDKSDTYMDLFHPMFWSDNSELYTTWGSVYPPLNFLLLKAVKWLIFGNQQFSDAFELRSEAGRYPIWLFLTYLAIPLMVIRTSPWRDFSASEKLPIYFAIVLASPMLFTLERANLILLVLPILAIGLATAGTLCCVAIAILINIKPYFAIFIVTFLLARHFEDAFIICLTAGAIFLGAGIFVDSEFLTFLSNVLNFSQNEELFSAREVLSLPATISSYAHALRTFYAQGGNLRFFDLDGRQLAALLEATKWIVLAAALGALVLGRRIPVSVVQLVSIAIVTNLGTWVGGYAIIFYIAAIPMLLHMKYRWFYIPVVLTMLAPLDVVSLLTQNIGDQSSYLAGRVVSVDWDLGLGAVLRPSLNLGLLAVISWEVFERYVWLKGATAAEFPSYEWTGSKRGST